MSNPSVWDSKNPRQSIRYSIAWHVRRTGYLPTEIILPEAVQVEEVEADALALEMKGLGIAVRVDGAVDGIVCKGLGESVKMHQLPWPPLYNEQV